MGPSSPSVRGRSGEAPVQRSCRAATRMAAWGLARLACITLKASCRAAGHQ